MSIIALLMLASAAPPPEVAPHPQAVVITSARELLSRSNADIRRRLPVRITGIVTYINPKRSTCFVQDETGSAYVNDGRTTKLDHPTREIAKLKLGDRVRVDGFSLLGQAGYKGVDPGQIDVLDTGRPLPNPLPLKVALPNINRYPGQRVLAEGVVESIRETEIFQAFLLRTEDGEIEVCDYAQSYGKNANKLINSRVQVTGILLPRLPTKSKIKVVPQIYTASRDHFVILMSSDPFENPPITIQEFLTRVVDEDMVPLSAHVTGEITAIIGQQVYLQDETAAISFTLVDSQPGPIGSWAAAAIRRNNTGESTQSFLGEIRSAGIEAIPVNPVEITPSLIQNRNIKNQFVTFQGKVWKVESMSGLPQLIMFCDFGLVRVSFPVAIEEIPNWNQLQAEANVELKGVCTEHLDRTNLDWFEVVLRSPDDLRLIRPAPPEISPSWWTPNRRIAAIAGMIALILFPLLWIGTLRVQIRRQTMQLTEQFAKEAELRASYRDLFENAADAVWVTDRNGILTDMNLAMEKLIGVTREQAIGRVLSDFLSPSQAEMARESRVSKVEGLFELTIVPQNGNKPVRVEVSSRILPGGGVQTVARNLSERTLLQERVQRVQKLEAVGRLAGGIAHDFNNLLTVINGSLELVLDRIPIEHEARELTCEALAAGQRAANLTRQLLAFSRQRYVTPVRVGLNQIVQDTVRLLRRLIGSPIKLVTDLGHDVPDVVADPGMLEQVLMNLAVNSRDAMPEGGTLLVRTLRSPEGKARITVIDTGHGMTHEVQSHIFEPFFTTKEIGKGTGLGLATVYGIVQSLQGTIRFVSHPGSGTTFEIDLPAAPAAERPGSYAVKNGHMTHRSHQGSLTVLLVEDDESVRTLARNVLESSGMTILSAEDGPSALKLAREFKGTIDVLLTDVLMPQMSGRELVEVMLRDRPQIGVIFMSGYAGDEIPIATDFDPGWAFIQKPFAPADLVARVREVLHKTNISHNAGR